MYKEFSLAITEGVVGISIADRRPREAVSYGAGFANAESGDKGGAYFQQHRQGNSPSYVANVLPTEIGYVSVGREPCQVLAISGGSGKLSFAAGCRRDHEVPATYSPITARHPVQLPNGTVLMEGHGAAVKLFQFGKDGMACRSEVQVKGLELSSCKLVGISRIGGRFLTFTETEIYVSSAEDSFDFTPSLRTQAQALSINYPIGALVSIVPIGSSAYVLGKVGGVLMTCTGDANFPYAFEVIDDFDGIEHYLNCQVDYASMRALCWSRSGLVWLEGKNATKSWADISRSLFESRRVVFPEHFPIRLELSDGLHTRSATDGYASVGLDHTDSNSRGSSLGFHAPSTLHVEQLDVTRIVAVRNSSQRYVFVSYAADSLDRHSGVYPVFQRCFVYDKWLQRSSVLHTPHTDIMCSKDDAIFFCDEDGDTFQVVREAGVGLLHWDRYTSTNRRAIKMTGIAAYGDFDTNGYALGDALSGHTSAQPPIPSHVPCVVGQDISVRNSKHSLRLLTKQRSELLYSGLVVGHQVSFTFGFVGRLNELVLRRAQ